MVAKNKKIRALAMFSGGLDSILAIKLIQEQEIEVTAINFTTPFFPNDKAIESASKLGIKLIVVDLSSNKNYLNILKKPKHGYGAGLNPCIDCKIFMLKEAAKVMKKEKFDFIITGEVLDERPMSQTYNNLKIIEAESGLKGKLLRPLSAKVLPETDIVKKFLVNPNQLLAIHGRQRKEQFGLALRYNITEYPSPAGGCLLCEKTIKAKLLDLFEYRKISEIDFNELTLLKIGRHFRVGKTKFIVGRNKEEKEKLFLLKKSKEYLFHIIGASSPVVLLKNEKPKKGEIEIAAKFTAYYSKSPEKNILIDYWKDEKNKEKISIKLNDSEMENLLKNKIG